ncbi:fibrous sheath CABYR-binding protein-like [Girardinichthys multiradiatus]|uniref:fibrous sheath CABYR-binding protein-like n=1 Tax=Girardinichthys multiradiatus TaxID=208333 RepID=UPI001FAE30F0|nr:fibrous sheath CABYR-binding protein-like [Girardinichthys multiradiatus]
MGCSSSSAQTVEQEKRPGTKPEESNGDTVAVRNGSITEDVQTIEDQIQLPAQTVLPDNLKAGPEDEKEAVLVGIEAQEDLGSGEELLEAPEQQSEPEASEELAPQPESYAAVEDSAEPDVVVAVSEVAPPVEEALPLETVPAEAPPDVKDTEETPNAKSVEAVQTEVTVLAEEVLTVPTAEPVVEDPAGTAGAVEVAVAEGAFKAPTEDEKLVQAKAPTGNTAPETVSDTEMTPVTPVKDVAQAKCNSATEEETDVSTATAVTASSAEVSCPIEVTTASEPAKTSEAPPVRVNPESSTDNGVTAEVPVVEPITTQSEAPSDPEPANEPVPEPSPEVASVNETYKDTAGEIAKKQD